MTDVTRKSRSRQRAFALASVALLAIGLGAKTLAAGPTTAPVKGKVVGWEKLLPQVYADASKNEARHTWREPSPTVKQEFRKLSANVSRDVCIAAISSTGSANAHEPLPIKVTGGRITPSTIVLSPGSRLSLKNVDPFPHNLYEVGNDKWAVNAVAPGSSREWAATAPGVHVLRDELFPSVVMYVVVDPAAVEFAFPDHEGAFTLTLPSGDYTLKAFFDGKQAGKDSTVHVGFGGVEMREPMTVGGESK
jgi:hypothetical protein